MHWPNHRSSYQHPEKQCLIYDLIWTCPQHPDYNFFDPNDFLEFSSIQMKGYTDAVTAKTVDQEKCNYWHDMRIGRITGSLIFETSRCNNTSTTELVNIIFGNTKITPTDEMRRATRLKREVIDAVSKKLGESLTRCGLLLDARYPWLGASPDAAGRDFVVEIKCPLSQESFKNYVDESTNTLTDKYFSQMQLQMHLKKVHYGYFVLAAPDFETSRNIKIVKVQYDSQFTKKMLDNALLFWKKSIYSALLNQI